MTWDFAGELDRWGPAALRERSASPEEARAYCQDLATTHYENFPVVTRLLPRELHQHFFNVYGFCRWSDDLGDEVGDPERSLELLAWWRQELDRCMAGEADHPVFVALRETIAEFGIPVDPFADLISAFEQDQTCTRYETFDELRDYCRRSADPVGRLVLYLFREATEENFAASDAVCTGLQLANFWQDVARDDAIGRVYLPREDCRRFGYTEEQHRRCVSTPEFRRLLEFECQRARDLLNAGWVLVDRLPYRFQIDVELFLRGGLCILDRIRRIDYAVWEQRPRVTKFDFARLFLTAWCARWGRRLGLCRNPAAPAPSAPVEQVVP